MKTRTSGNNLAFGRMLWGYDPTQGGTSSSRMVTIGSIRASSNHLSAFDSKIAMTLKFSRKNFESAGLLPATKVVFDLEEINADENWIVIKISKAAAE